MTRDHAFDAALIILPAALALCVGGNFGYSRGYTEGMIKIDEERHVTDLCVAKLDSLAVLASGPGRLKISPPLFGPRQLREAKKGSE